MTHPLFDDNAMKAYFATLPETVREAVFQSGVQLNTLAELQAFAENYTNKNLSLIHISEPTRH